MQEPYTYIIFRASEVKDLAVDEQLPPVQQHSVLDDPAVIGVRRSIGLLPFPFLLFFSLFCSQPFRARRSRHWHIVVATRHSPFYHLFLAYPLSQLTNVLVP